MAEKTVTVPNIACGHCVATIERTLGDLQGVEGFSVDQESKQVTVQWTEAGINWEQIATHLRDVGYPPE